MQADSKENGSGTAQGRAVDTLHNQDKVFKESFSLFKGGSLDFLDAELSGEVTEILNTEITETATKKAYSDNALKLSTGKGIHSEWEAEIDNDDMVRFASYHIDLTRMHKIPFTTVIITTKKSRAISYVSPSMSFTPKIINLKDRDADKILAEIGRKLNAGESGGFNELEIIYLPLYGSTSGKTTSELLDIAIKLVPKAVKSDKQKRHKILDLLVLLTGSFVSESELNEILEENMRILEDSIAVRVLEDRGRRQGIEQGIEQAKKTTAMNMFRDGDDHLKISRITGLDLEQIAELYAEFQSAMSTV